MRLHYGAVPEDPTFNPQVEDWKGIREPGPEALQIFAIPVALLLFVVLALILPIVSPDLREWMGSEFTVKLGVPEGTGWVGKFGFLAGMLALWLVSMLLIILAHELIHALLMPHFGMTPHTLIAVWPEKLLFYAHHSQPMPRNQLLLVFLGPLIGLTVLPVLIIIVLAQIPGTLQAQIWLAVLAIFNGVSACGDVIGFVLILFQVPGKAQVRNQGWKSYWKEAVRI